MIDILRSDPSYKEALLDALCVKTGRESEIRDILEYVIDNKLELFDYDFLNTPLYDGDDKTSDLILPTVRRVWSKVFIEPPTLLKGERLELFQLLFNVDEFIDYFIDIFNKCNKSLEPFEYLDRSVETLSLIVDNYIAILFDIAYNTKNIEQDIRDAKLRKLV